MVEETDSNGNTIFRKEQTCFNRLFTGEPHQVHACDICCTKHSGRGKLCYRPNKTPLHRRKQIKHEKGVTLEHMRRAQERFRERNPEGYQKTYGEN